MAEAWIDGRAVARDAAIAAAARLLSTSRLPVIAGLGTDIAGARAAIALAQRVGGVIDHMHSEALLRHVALMRETGMLVTTPNEADRRADTLLFAGDAVFAHDALIGRLLAPPTVPDVESGTRRIVALGAPRAHRPKGDVRYIGADPGELPVMLAALRAQVAGRPVNGGPHRRALQTLAAELSQARFGAAIWSPAALAAPVSEMLCGLVDDLNAQTRFSGLALAPGANGAGVLQACGWTTGFPMRTGFARGRAEHDPWRFDAARLVASGETDCVLWVSAYDAAAPDWNVPTIALTPAAAGAHAVHIHIPVGRPGRDHDAVEHFALTDTLVYRAAQSPTDAIAVADVLARIAAALPDPGHAGAH